MTVAQVELRAEPGIINREAKGEAQRSWRTWLIGRPLATADAPHQTIGKAIGLAVFSSDAMSSVAYAPQELMLVLAAAGVAGLAYATPLALAIIALLIVLTISYEQTIHAYPGGGGAYIVARDNLGELPAQTAGAALLTDYVLTVAVSISSGVAQIVSAYPHLAPFTVPLAVGMVLFVMLINLRGVKESGAIFAVPTYSFLLMAFLTVGVGLVRLLTGTLGTVADPPHMESLHGAQALTLFLLLRAFASGTSALTGVEAISNGITAFREPRSRNAGITLVMMAVILGSLMLGITFLSHQIGAVPSEGETVVSQLARTAYGNRGLLYLATIVSTTLILLMAANTSFADFPRLGALVAADGFLPRQLTYKGSRLVYSRGIVLLSLVACLLIIVFRASVTALIPLYAIGVFLSFTLSQGGMARRWWRVGHLRPGETIVDPGSTLTHDAHWQLKMAVNALGAVTTLIVMMVFTITKFPDGAWIIVVIVPALVLVFFRIHRHYRELAGQLSLERFGVTPRSRRHRVILAIGGVHRGTIAALSYAQTLSDDVTAIYVSLDAEETQRIRDKWSSWAMERGLVVLNSPYRLLIEPLLAYIQQVVASRQSNDIISVIVPQFVPKHFWENALHNQTALMLRMALLFTPGVVITEVPYQIQ